MTRKKRNKNNYNIRGEGYIKKYFGSDISKILVPNDRSVQNCELPYVSHPDAECILSEYLKNDDFGDKSIVFTGLTGSGKTTIIRHVFNINNNSNTPHIANRTVVIPIDFNRSQLSAENAILSNFRVAIERICNKQN